MRVIADITDPDVVQKILDHIEAQPPRLSLRLPSNPETRLHQRGKFFLLELKIFSLINPTSCKLPDQYHYSH